MNPTQHTYPNTTYNGGKLREIREDRNIDLDEISLSTKIQKMYLKNIEEENFRHLPPLVYVIGYIKTYSTFLNIDPDQVIKDFKIRFEVWQEEN